MTDLSTWSPLLVPVTVKLVLTHGNLLNIILTDTASVFQWLKHHLLETWSVTPKAFINAGCPQTLWTLFMKTPQLQLCNNTCSEVHAIWHKSKSIWTMDRGTTSWQLPGSILFTQCIFPHDILHTCICMSCPEFDYLMPCAKWVWSASKKNLWMCAVKYFQLIFLTRDHIMDSLCTNFILPCANI
jgi:hypothetical protein